MRKPKTPGDFLRDEIRPHFDITQDDLAKALGVSRYSVNQIETGRRSITAEMALRLSHVTGTTARFWMDLQRDLDLYEAQQRIGSLVDELEVLSAP